MMEALRRDLATLVGERGVVGPEDLDPFLTDYRGNHGRALAVVKPGTSLEVSELVRYAFARAIPIIVQGANTGLVGASIPNQAGDQIVISMDRLRRIGPVIPGDRLMWAEAGARLSAINAASASHGLFFPIDVGSDPSLGGMIATNTGGSRLIRYGDVRANIASIEIVLGDAEGTIIADELALRKNNIGLDIKQLFIGCNGLGGIVTGAQVRLQRLPRQVATAFVVPKSRAVIAPLVGRIEDECGELLSALEGMSINAFNAAIRHQPQLRNPFSQSSPPEYLLLVEASSLLTANSGFELDSFFNEAMFRLVEGAPDLVSDVVIGRPSELWAIRHAVSDGVRALGPTVGFDLSFHRDKIEAFCERATNALKDDFPEFVVHDFGHWGDGGVHFNLVYRGPKEAPPPGRVTELRDRIYDIAVRGFGGSFSAEHGIGPINARYLRIHGQPAAARLRDRIRAATDPGAILGHRFAHC